MRTGYFFAALLIGALPLRGAIFSQEDFEKRAEGSKIKAVAAVESVSGSGDGERKVTFRLEKTVGKPADVPIVFTGVYEGGLAGGVFRIPEKGDRVFVTVTENGGAVTSCTKMSPCLEEGLAKYPDKIKYTVEMAYVDDGSDEYLAKAAELRRAKKHTEALTELGKAARLNPSNERVYFSRGQVFEAQGKSRAAADEHTKAIELNKSYSEAYYHRGRCLATLGDFKHAAADFKESCDLSPRNADAFYGRGVCLSALGKTEEAAASLSKALELRPAFVPALLLRGKSFLALGKNSEAEADFSACIAASETQSDAWFHRALAELGMDKKADALRDLNKTVELDPKNGRAYYYRATLSDDDAKARADLDKAIGIDPSFPYSYYKRGRIHKKAGDLAKAAADFSKAVELDSESGQGKRLLALTLFQAAKSPEDYAKAAAEFKAAATLQKDNPYNALWEYIALRRAGGKESAAGLEAVREKLPAGWESGLLGLFTGKTTPEELESKAAAASDPKKSAELKCEAFFYTAQYFLINGDSARARTALKNCLATGVTSFTEHEAAKDELKKLK
jgi:tetratricopeptide (TPR) repeat protein